MTVSKNNLFKSVFKNQKSKNRVLLDLMEVNGKFNKKKLNKKKYYLNWIYKKKRVDQ